MASLGFCDLHSLCACPLHTELPNCKQRTARHAASVATIVTHPGGARERQGELLGGDGPPANA